MALYMQQWQLKGLSLSVMRGDSLLYAKGYGWADEEKGEKMQPSHLLRIASVSKLVTAAGIMVLCEQGKLSLADTVFGPRGLLPEYSGVIKDRNYYKITVEDLLRHKAGFTVRGGDPMFSTRTIMRVNNLEAPPTNEELARIVLARKLGYLPGTSQSYSNFGFMLLGLIIEKVSAQSYEDFIQENVLRPAGCVDFHIAGNYPGDAHKGEVHYYVPVNETLVPEYNCSGDSVVRCYGGNDIRALGGAGAWVASTPEIARFVSAIDGRGVLPDIISQKSVDAMVEYFDKETYSLGWNDTEPSSGWTRSGTFSGTSALVKYFPDGECWVMVTNTSTWKGPGFSRYTAGLFRALREGWSDKLPARNLFEKQ
ncbi:MAG: beta-lactamase family protein [Bacteroidales bacterium]|nr:beta-lactamase family protein [Bacteroidales bacterium]